MIDYQISPSVRTCEKTQGVPGVMLRVSPAYNAGGQIGLSSDPNIYRFIPLVLGVVEFDGNNLGTRIVGISSNRDRVIAGSSPFEINSFMQIPLDSEEGKFNLVQGLFVEDVPESYDSFEARFNGESGLVEIYSCRKAGKIEEVPLDKVSVRGHLEVIVAKQRKTGLPQKWIDGHGLRESQYKNALRRGEYKKEVNASIRALDFIGKDGVRRVLALQGNYKPE